MRKLHAASLLTILMGWSAVCANLHAEVLFEADFEDGYIPYVGSGNKHPGGGYISFLGGEITSPLNPGDGNSNYQTHQNVVLSDEPAARGSTAGSDWSLKTHYRAGQADNYQKNTTIIKFPESDIVYVQWKQKWSTNWVWPTDQQKLIKIKNSYDTSNPDYWTQNFKLSWGKNYINLTKKTPDKQQFETYVFADYGGEETDYRMTDSINNGLDGGSDGEFYLQRDRWYTIQVMVKGNTPGQSDGQYRYWIDGNLVFELTGADTRGNSSRGLTSVQMQHVVQFANNEAPDVDMPTYMDDIVIATQFIGDSSQCPQCPSTPSQVSVQ